jgi:hypothetical protein
MFFPETRELADEYLDNLRLGDQEKKTNKYFYDLNTKYRQDLIEYLKSLL